MTKAKGTTAMYRLALTVCSFLAWTWLWGDWAVAQTSSSTSTSNSGSRSTPAAQHRSDSERAKLTNRSTLGLAAGQLEGAPLRFATELARVLDDGADLRILPVVTRGPFENVDDLLYLNGIDMAIVYGDALEHFASNGQIANINRRINYITHLFPSELHVFARPEIKSLGDLAGKPVNFNTPGTAAAYSGPIIFGHLGIKVDARFEPHPVAMTEMATSDKYAATVWVSTKPLDPFLRRKWPEGFKFLPVPLTEKLEEYYMPAQLEASDYPGLISPGQTIQTISVPAVLAVYSWRDGTERHARLLRFIDHLFARLSTLQTRPGLHPRWADLNLAATVPGWRRYPPMKARLDALAAAGSEGVPAASAAGHTSSAQPVTPTRRPEAAIETGELARKALEQSGYRDISDLTVDRNGIWRGTGRKGERTWRIGVSRQGQIYERYQRSP